MLVDGGEIPAASYTKTEGDAVITLGADYLATLLAGVHTIALESASGTAETTFTVAMDPTDIPAYNDIDAYQYKDFREKETVAVPALSVKDEKGGSVSDTVKFVVFIRRREAAGAEPYQEPQLYDLYGRQELYDGQLSLCMGERQ